MAELEAAKRAREAAETELRGSQVQASIAAATIQALEEEIAKVGSDLEELKGCALEQGRNEFKDKNPFIPAASEWIDISRRLKTCQVCPLDNK